MHNRKTCSRIGRSNCWLNSVAKHITITLLAFMVVGMFAMFALNLSFLNPIAQVVEDFEMTDIYYQILQDTDEVEVDDEVTIVDMSELYSRRELAATLHDIEAMKPKVVGVDIVFEGLKEDSVGDEMMREVASKYNNMVYSYKLLDYVNDSTGYADAVHSFFAAEGTNEGFTNMQRNLYGGMKRQLSLGQKHLGKVVPSFITQVVNGLESTRTLSAEERELNINFTPKRFRTIEPDSICQHPEWITDKVVLFGATKDEQDMHYTPLGKMAGVELLAYSVTTLLEQSEVWTPGIWLTVLLSFSLVLLTEILSSAYKTFAKGRRSRLLRFVMSMSFVWSILLFFWMSFWVWVAFILFCKCGVSLNLGWVLSAMAMLVLAENIYNECSTAIKEKNNGK